MSDKTPFFTAGAFALTVCCTLFSQDRALAADPVGNACPPEGCIVRITRIEPAGSELQITWQANFKPDVARNHIHVFWDTFQPQQVSSDAEAKGFQQGDWVPTAAYPSYVTEGAMAVANRSGSTKICVVAADRDHAIYDPRATHCINLSGL